MKALLIWNNLWADRRVCFIHPLPGTSEIPVLRAEQFSCVRPLWSAAPLLLPIISYLSQTVLYSSRLCFSFLDSPPSFWLPSVLSLCTLMFHLAFINFLFLLFLSPLIPSLRFSSPYPPTSFPFFPSLLFSSLSPYSQGIQWIIQKRCRMIMGN